MVSLPSVEDDSFEDDSSVKVDRKCRDFLRNGGARSVAGMTLQHL